MSEKSHNRGGGESIKARKFAPPNPIPAAMYEQVQVAQSTANSTQAATSQANAPAAQAAQSAQAVSNIANQSAPAPAKGE